MSVSTPPPPVDDDAVTVGSLRGPRTPASSRWLFLPPARCRGRPLSQPASGFASGLTSGRPAARLLESCTCRSAARPLPLPSGPVSGPDCPRSGAGRLSGQWSSWSILRSVVKLVAFCVHISANPNFGLSETACRLSSLGEVQLGGSACSPR